MEKILKGYKFRMYPTQEQIILIEKSFGVSRYIYNHYLEVLNKTHFMNAYEMIKSLKELSNENTWLKEVDSCLLRAAIFDLENAYQKYRKENAGFPTYKSKVKSRKSYRTNNTVSSYKGKVYNTIQLDLINRKIKLPKLKEVDIRGYRYLTNISGRIINATMSKEAGKYYVSVCVEEIKEINKVKPQSVVGIDLGIKNLVTTSEGIVYENKKLIEKYEKKLKGLQRWLARSQKGSKNRNKIKEKIRRTYQKLKNARKYFLHSISKELTEENDIIVTETLKIKNMVKNSRLAKHIHDASWYELIRQLQYKSNYKGKWFYQVDSYYASSQICSHCDYKEKRVKDLSIREWVCPSCGNRNDRDIGASENIMFEGLKKYIKEQMAI